MQDASVHPFASSHLLDRQLVDMNHLAHFVRQGAVVYRLPYLHGLHRQGKGSLSVWPMPSVKQPYRRRAVTEHHLMVLCIVTMHHSCIMLNHSAELTSLMLLHSPGGPCSSTAMTKLPPSSSESMTLVYYNLLIRYCSALPDDRTRASIGLGFACFSRTKGDPHAAYILRRW